MNSGLKLATLLTEIKVDIAGFKKNMGEASKIGVLEAEKISKKMSNVTKTGESLSKTGDKLTKGLTLPILGLGTATGKMAVDFESNFAKVSTLLDDNAVDFGQYKEELLDASSKAKVAVDEFSESVYSSISAGVDQTKAIGFTTDAMKLAKGGFTDGAKSVDVLTTAINGYSLKAEDASRISDLLITTQNLGKTTVDELASSMGTVIPVASASNFKIEELSAAYAQLTKNGIATAESGTYLKAMLSEITKSGSIADKTLRDLTGKGFADLKKDGMATTDILGLLDKAAKKNDKTLKDMFGSVEAGSAALVMYKNNGTEYNEMLNGMATSAGATQAAFDKMDATPAEQLKGSLNELRNEGIKFGAAFVPVITQAGDVLSKTADAFSNLSDKQKDNVIKWGMVLAAVGPTMKVVGGTITTFTKISSVMGGVTKALGVVGGSHGIIGGFTGLLGVCAPVAAGVTAVGTGIYAMHENTQLMNRSMIESKEEMSLMERALARLNGVEVKSRKELEELGLVHKEFSAELSPEFQKAVKKSTEKVQEFQVFLGEIGFDNVISKQESDEFNRRVNDTCNEAIRAVQSKKNESQSALKNLFIADDQMIDESEQRVLEILSKSSDKQLEEIDALRTDIIAIKQKAVEAGRTLNEQEIADIEAKNARIRQIELEALGGTQEEIAYAKNEFNARIATMDAKSASKLMKEKAKIRDEEIVKIKASYDTQIQILKEKSEQCTGAEKEELEKQIANLQEDRQKKIDVQNQLWDDYMGIVRKKNPEIIDVINRYNGEILTNEDKHQQQMLYEMMNHYDGLNKIVKSGCYQLWDNTEGMWKDIAVTVDENTGAITGMYERNGREFAGYTKEMMLNAKNMAESQKDSYELIDSSMGVYLGKAGQIVDANGNVVASMDKLKKHTDGTRQGIVDINGTPYNIKVNKDGTISALEAISRKADEAAKDRTIHIAAQYMSNPSYAAYNGVKGDQYGWHFNGLNNVPYDGYKAILHKDERVLTAQENKEYSQGVDRTNYDAIRSIIRNELSGIVIKMNDREMGRACARYEKERR